jgi:hypothetical protein
MRWLIAILILMVPFSLAEPVLNLQQEESLQGETVFGTIEVSGEFTKPIEDSSIKFYEGRKEVFIEHGVQFYEGKHYFYAYANREGNFTIKVANILYKEGVDLKSADLEKNFTIVKGNSSEGILGIKPGVVFTSTNPKVTLSNKGGALLNVTVEKQDISIEPLMSYELTLAPKEAFSMLKVSTYKEFQVPIIFLGLNGSINQTTKVVDLRGDPASISLNLTIGNDSERIVSLYNFGDENLTGLKSTTSLGILKLSKLSDISGRGILNVTFKFSPVSPGHFSDNVTLEYTKNGSSEVMTLPVEVFVLPSGSSPQDFVIVDESCAGLNGTVCPTTQICGGETTFAKGGEYCCLSQCKDVEVNDSGEGFGWMIGLVLILALGLLGYYLYKKQKKVAPPTPQQTITSTADTYSQRISGGVQRS